jgi:hypothetical protein
MYPASSDDELSPSPLGARRVRVCFAPPFDLDFDFKTPPFTHDDPRDVRGARRDAAVERAIHSSRNEDDLAGLLLPHLDVGTLTERDEELGLEVTLKHE